MEKLINKLFRSGINTYEINIGNGSININVSSLNSIMHSDSILVREYFGKYMINDNSNGMKDNIIELSLKKDSKTIIKIISCRRCNVDINGLGEINNLDIIIGEGTISIKDVEALSANLSIKRIGSMDISLPNSRGAYQISCLSSKAKNNGDLGPSKTSIKKYIKIDGANSHVDFYFGKRA